MPGPYTNQVELPGNLTATPARTLRKLAVRVMRTRGVRTGRKARSTIR